MPRPLNLKLNKTCLNLVSEFLGQDQYLKEHRGAEYVAGVELVPEHAGVAAQRLDKVFVGNMETDTLDIPAEFFDCIICADVLEHMIDPWTFVQPLKGYLVPNGIIVSSIPNVAHITVILDLLRGRWEYHPSGLLDKGHLRFFTKRSITAMFHDAGFTIERWDINASQALKFKITEFLTFGLFRPLSVNQYLFVARLPEGKSTNAGTIGNHR